jgi:alcohol dehydrogenase class IV
MVKAFQFSRLPLIYFGTGKISLLSGLIKRYGARIILVTDQNSFLRSPGFEMLRDSLSNAGISYLPVTVATEPSPDLIDNHVIRFRGEPIDAVVAIGGGSVIDTGKALSAMLYNEFSVREFLEGVGNREHPGIRLPFIAVPTTAGTGSEATKNAVISEVGSDGYKKSLRHENFVPDIAIVDPDLTVSCPPHITAAGGMDCFTQLIEAFLSVKSNEYTDALAIEGLKAVSSSLLDCFLNGENTDARSGMSFAALTSGICLANAGLGAVHGFASSAGGLFNIPHGVLCGTLMASANAINVRELKKTGSNPTALVKYASLGRLFINDGDKPDGYYIDGFIHYLEKLTDDLKLPGLSKYGIRKEDLGKICEMTEIKNNPVKLGKEDLQEILYERL